MFAYSPFGDPIRGTAEVIEATAETETNGFHIREDGTLGYEHYGDTDVWWDSSTTKVERGLPVFIDEAGDEWPADQLILSADETAPDFYLSKNEGDLKIYDAVNGEHLDEVYTTLQEALPEVLALNRAAEIARDAEVEA